MKRPQRQRIKESSLGYLASFQKALPFLEPSEFTVQEFEADLDKKRWLYRVSDEVLLLDKLLSLELAKRVQEILPKEVMSFQRGIGPFDVLSDLKEWMKKGPTTGLYVIRTDLMAYTDSIKISDSAPLWSQLRRIGIDERLLNHVKQVLRPRILRDERGGERSRQLGIPTGLALTPVIANLYAIELDRAATREDAIFYRRYGDDMILGSADPMALEMAWSRVIGEAKHLGLQFHPAKTKKLLWCRNGFTKPEYGEYRGTQYLDLLGFQVHYQRGLRLNTEKMRELKRGFVARVHLTKRLVNELYPTGHSEECARLLVDVANRYFSPENRELNARVQDFYHWVNDQGQIQELEDFVARVLTQTIAGVRGTRAYSMVSWRDLIQKWGWKSPRHQWIASRRVHEG